MKNLFKSATFLVSGSSLSFNSVIADEEEESAESVEEVVVTGSKIRHQIMTLQVLLKSLLHNRF